MIVGTLFILVQVASQQGYIQVNWSKVHKSVEKSLDVVRYGLG